MKSVDGKLVQSGVPHSEGVEPSSILTESQICRALLRLFGQQWKFHRLLGSGFAEPVYQQAMEIELKHRTIPQ